MSSGGAARRAILRWAIRLFRREWRQQILILTMLTVAVAAAVVGVTSAINAASDGSGEYGTANSYLRLETPDAAEAAAALAHARDEYGVVDVIAHQSAAVRGSLATLDVRDQDPASTFGAPMLSLRRGTYPVGGQAALTDGAAGELGVAIGDTVTLGETSVTVVGIVENPGDLGDEFALVAPGTLASPTWYKMLANSDVPAGEVRATGSGTAQSIHGRGSQREATETVVLIAATMALALVGLLATAGFLVVAQRRQRHLGLLQAMGARDRSVRLVMVANGAIVAMISAGVGLALGVVCWFFAAPTVETAAGHRIGRFELPWSTIVAAICVALVMAVLAAWWPARAVSRLPVMTALSGRPATPRPVHRSLLLAIAFLAVGMLGIAHSGPTTDHVEPLYLISGLLAVVLGTVFAAPAAIRWLAVLAPHLPFAPRLALRDLARYQARAAAALAAITLGLGIAVSIVGVAGASTNRVDEGNLSTHELLIQVGDRRTAPDPTLTAEQVAELDARAERVAAALGSDVTGVPVDIAFPAASADHRPEPVSMGRVVDAHTIRGLGFPFVASPALLSLYGIDPSMLDAEVDLLTSRTEVMLLVDMTVRVDPSDPPIATAPADLPVYSSAPNSLVTPSAMTRHGWRTARAGWIVESATPFTSAQIRAARAAAAEVGLFVEVRDQQSDLQSLRTGSTLVGALLALAIVAMSVGLIRGESVRDVRTLTATGAGAGTRRALAAWTAAAFAMLGAVLAIGGAYAALAAAYHADIGRLAPVPFTPLVSLAVGLPLAATVAGWCLAGKEPRTFSRQALD